MTRTRRPVPPKGGGFKPPETGTTNVTWHPGEGQGPPVLDDAVYRTCAPEQPAQQQPGGGGLLGGIFAAAFGGISALLGDKTPSFQREAQPACPAPAPAAPKVYEA